MTLATSPSRSRDEERSRRFYERYFGFEARPPRRYPDGVLMLYDTDGFALALGPAEGPLQLPRFLHFGFATRDRNRCSNSPNS